MYIKNLRDINIGPLIELSIEFPFEDEKPKPIIFVGENGTGKSTILSNIVDAFYEIAGKAFSDARNPAENEGYQYYKLISQNEIRFDQKYMYSYMLLEDSNCDPTKIEYIFKSGELSADEFKQKIGTISANLSWSDDYNNYKQATIEKKNAESILGRDVLCYFGPERYEKPFWLGNSYYESLEFEHPTVKQKWAGKMENPILIRNMTKLTLQWLLDVIVDSRGDIKKNDNSLNIVNVSIDNLLKLGVARSNIETIMSRILNQDVYFGLNFRNSNASRFNIMRREDNSLVVPTLDSLSTGQSALFNMFATIVRYSDTNNINNSIDLSNITGIVVIDEIELHLHSRLQRETLPKLITLFPKVQFIITTHSPLFLLGMDEQFGADGYEIYQMPEASKISAERFSEFQQAYLYLSKTKKYEDEILSAISSKQEKMLIVTEGATDWKHMKAAYESLRLKPEHRDIFDELDFEFLEYEPANSKDECINKLEMGDKQLCEICKIFSKLKQPRKIVFIADRDVPDTNKKLGNKEGTFKNWGNNVYSFLLPISESREQTPAISIEHLYPDDIIKTEVSVEGQEVKRRLYMGNEFDIRGISTNLLAMCERTNICGPNHINIIEGSNGERVTLIKDSTINLALSKMTFAKMILKSKPPFDNLDFSNFIQIFTILKDISCD